MAVAGGEALERAGDGSTDTTIAVAAGLGWAAAVAAMAVPSVVSLTATRVIVPLSVPVAAVAIVAGAGGAGWVLLAVSTVAAVVACSGELGRAFVQASAYGEEDRHLLRPPPAYALAAVISWALSAAATIAAVLSLADRRWIVAGAMVVVAAGLVVWSWPRWHRLSRRWFVTVPVGVVVHDHLVLAETLMLRRQELATVHLAPVGTDAADLTGPAGGHAIEIVTSESVTAILAGTPRDPGGTAIHLTGCLVAPTRPGRVLASIAARRFPVG